MNALLLPQQIKDNVNLSCLAYSDKDDIKLTLDEGGFEEFEFIENKKTDTQVICCIKDGVLHIDFRGTEIKNFRDWLTNLDCRLVEISNGIRGHSGFNIDVSSVYGDILTYIKSQFEPEFIYVGGHSQGAGDATICGIKLFRRYKISGVIQNACPRCLSRKSADVMGVLFGDLFYRFVNNNDIVTRVPVRTMGYSHINKAKLFYFLYTAQCVQELSAWEEFKDRVYGNLIDFAEEKGADALVDHRCEEEYIKLINTIPVE